MSSVGAGGMLVLDGSSGVDAGGLTLSGAFTIEGWLWLEPGKKVSNRDGFLVSADEDVHVNMYRGQFRLASYVEGEPRGDVVVANTRVKAGEWHHYALVRDDAGVLRVYVDGALDATADRAWTHDLTIGRIGETKRGVTEGALDEMRVWDVARSGAEIAAAKDGVVEAGAAGLVRDWRFDTPGQLVDAAGNAAPAALPSGVQVLPTTAPVSGGAPVNAAPTAGDDAAATDPGTPVVVAVLANDADPEDALDAASVLIAQGPASGTATVLPDGRIEYDPTPGFAGTDTFTYTVADTEGTRSGAATVSVQVGEPDQPAPEARPDSFGLVEDAPYVPLAVLVNDVGPGGAPLSIAAFTQPDHGTVTLVDGELRYTPDADYDGTDAFGYSVTAGQETSGFATVDLTILPSFTQPQTQVDARVAPELDPSGVFMVIEKVAKLPLAPLTNKQPDMNSLAFAGDRIFVSTEGDVDNESEIYELVDDGLGGRRFELFLDVGAVLPVATGGRDLANDNSKHGGLRGIAFHPEFDDPASDGYGKFYTSQMEDRPTDITGHHYLSDATDPVPYDGVLSEWTYDHALGAVDEASYREVFRVGMPVFDHAIRQISFNPHAEVGDEDYGLLYVGHGDGSVQSAIAGGGLNDDALGKILRIDPLRDGADPFSVPASNPFVGDPAMLDEVYALGLRNPAHLSFAQAPDGTTDLIVTTIGRDNIDEVNIIEAGANYGWSVREGPFVHLQERNGIVRSIGPLPEDEADYGYTIPVGFIGHEGPFGAGFVGRALTGGYVIQNGSQDLDDQFIFAEFATTGRVFHMDYDDMRAAVTLLDPDDPARDHPSELTWVTPEEVMILFDHDGDDATAPLIKDSLKDVFDDNPDFEVTYARQITRADLRFGQGPEGELYIINKNDGWVYLAENTVAPEAELLF